MEPSGLKPALQGPSWTLDHTDVVEYWVPRIPQPIPALLPYSGQGWSWWLLKVEENFVGGLDRETLSCRTEALTLPGQGSGEGVCLSHIRGWEPIWTPQVSNCLGSQGERAQTHPQAGRRSPRPGPGLAGRGGGSASPGLGRWGPGWGVYYLAFPGPRGSRGRGSGPPASQGRSEISLVLPVRVQRGPGRSSRSPPRPSDRPGPLGPTSSP